MLWLTIKDTVEDQFNEGLSIFKVLSCSLELLDDILKNASTTVLCSIHSFKQCFSPDNAVYKFLRPLSNRTHWKALLFDSISALVALCEALTNGNTGSLVAIRSSLNKWDTEVKAHRVDEVSSLIVV